MAFSRNQNQLFNWGPLFGVEAPRSQSEIPSASLKYWIKANRRVLQAGNEIGPDKFLLVDFDELCSAPESEAQRINSFLEFCPDRATYQKVLSIPHQPRSMGRYKNHDLSQFDQDDLPTLKELGYSIEW